METICLKEHYPSLSSGTLTPLILPYPYDESGIAWKRPALIVVPGGAYAMTSKREGLIIASRFLSEGFQTFVLDYGCSPEHVYPEQVKELGCAIDYLKKHADEYHLNADEIFALGFSAGGHLVGDLAMEENDFLKEYSLDIDCKLKAIGLIYPVISSSFSYRGTHENLLKGLDGKEELLEKLSLHDHIHQGQPAAFIATSSLDQSVPPENSIFYALALKRCKIPFELHIFPSGFHGFSDASEEINLNFKHDPLDENIKLWPHMCANFFKRFCVEK